MAKLSIIDALKKSMAACKQYTDFIAGGGVTSTYSLDEKKVGTWVDGKPVYQRTFLGKANGTSSTILIENFNDFYTLIEANGCIQNDNGMLVTIGGIANSGTWTFAIHIDSNRNLVVFTGNDTRNGNYRVTLRYTKVNDSPLPTTVSAMLGGTYGQTE